jgi:4-hydroxybenzoate polyprenyltransferase
MKRYTNLPQAYLGIAFGFAVPMSFSAQTNTVPMVAWIMYLAVMLWALVYDTMYAMVDKEDDLKIGVKSTAILFGDKDREIMAGLQLIIITLMVVIGLIQQLGGFYYAGIVVAFGLSVYQQKLIFNRDKALCFKAFLNSNYFGLAVFSGLVLDYLVNT